MATGDTPWRDAKKAIGRGADAVFVTVGVSSVYDQAPRYLGYGGKVVMVGMPKSGESSTYEPQERFQLSSYKLMNQLLKTIDVTNNGEKSAAILDAIEADIHIIGVDSDLFFTAEENRETQKLMALNKPNVTYNEINSVHGHDAFLIEYNQLQKIIEPIFNKDYKKQKMKVIKFGGKSLANDAGLENVLNIISKKYKNGENFTVVVSARGNATNQLENILEKAAQKKEYTSDFIKFKEYQQKPNFKVDLSIEFLKLETIFEGSHELCAV